jgi:DNA-binding transcriptional regulator/RsmH inhibitor MraZ
MFGDKIIIGYSNSSVDEKKRIILPKFTGAAPGDKLIVIPEDNRLAIYSSYILEEYVDKIDEIKDFREKKELLKEFREYCESVIAEVIVDKSKRIALSNIDFNDNKVIVRGSGDRVVITGDFTYPELYKRKRS